MELCLRNGVLAKRESGSWVLIIFGFLQFLTVGPVGLVDLEAPVMGIPVEKVKALMTMVEEVVGPFFHGSELRPCFLNL